MVEEGKLKKLNKLFKEAAYFKALVLNSMMSLSKCNFELTAYIAKDKEYNEFWNILYDEYKLSKEMTLLISGYRKLMEEDPVTKDSIRIREQIVLPLLVIQQYALQKTEQGSLMQELMKRSYRDHYTEILTQAEIQRDPKCRPEESVFLKEF